MSTTPHNDPPLPGVSTGSVQTLASRPPPPSSNPMASKRLCFYKSGDPQFGALHMVINGRTFKTFDALLDALSKKVPLPFGVRTITTPRGTHTVRALDGLLDGGAYVCSDQRRIKPLNLEEANRRQVPWNRSTTRPLSTVRQGRREVVRQLAGRSGLGSRTARTATNTVAVQTPKRLIVFKNRDPGVKRIIVLQRRTAPSFEALLDYLSQVMQFPAVKLYTPDGRRVEGLAALILCCGVVVATGNEPFRLGNYNLQGPSQPAQSGISDSVNLTRIQTQIQKNKSVHSSSRSRSRNFSLSSERYIVNQINKSLSGSLYEHPGNQTGSLETLANQPLGSEDMEEACDSMPGRAGGESSMMPAEDNIEKSFRVNQDGSMTVEMKVHLTIKQEEMIQWTTTLSRTTITSQQRTVCSSQSESNPKPPDSNNNPSKGSQGFNGYESKKENHCTLAERTVAFNEKGRAKPKSSFRRLPTPGPRHGKRKASVEVQESTVGTYSYMERTAEGDLTEGYCIVSRSSRSSSSSTRTMPVPKPRKMGSTEAKHSQSHSSHRSSGVAEVLQVQNNGIEITETVMHIYETQGSYDNYVSNAQYSTTTPLSRNIPGFTDSGPRSSTNDCDVDLARMSTSTDSQNGKRHEILSSSSGHTFPPRRISNNLSSFTDNEAHTWVDSKSESSPKEKQCSESYTKKDSEDRSTASKKKKTTNTKAKKGTLTLTSVSDKTQKDSSTGSLKDIRTSKTDETLSQRGSERNTLSSHGGSNKKHVSGTESDKCGQKLEKEKKKNKGKSDEDSSMRGQALALNIGHLKWLASEKELYLKGAAVKDTPHNVNTSDNDTRRPPLKKKVLDGLPPCQKSMNGNKMRSQQNRDLSESISMPLLQSPSDVHQYVENWLKEIQPESVAYMEEIDPMEAECEPKPVFQIGSDSAEESEAKSELEKDNAVEECSGPVEDITAERPMSHLPLPIRCEGEPVEERAQKNTSFYKSMPTVRIHPAEQECQMHKSSEALRSIESESSQATKVDAKPGMKPVLEQMCWSSCAAAFGSPSKTLLSFLSVMTLKDNISSLGVDKSLCPEALQVMQSLEKIARIQDEDELIASLMSLQSSTSSKLQKSWREFLERNDIEESPPPLLKISEQRFALEVDSEGEDQNKEQPFGIKQVMEELNMSEELREEISSLVEGESKYSEDMDSHDEDMDNVEQVEVVSKDSDDIEAGPNSSPLSEPETEDAVSETSELCKSQDSEAANYVKALEETSDTENQSRFAEDQASLAEQRDQQVEVESNVPESKNVDAEPHHSPIQGSIVKGDSEISKNQDTETENEFHGETNCSEEENSNPGDQDSHEEEKHKCEEPDMISESEDVDVRHHSDSQSESSPKETESHESVSKSDSAIRSTDRKKEKTVKPTAKKDTLSLSPGSEKRQNDSLTGLFKDIRTSESLETLRQGHTKGQTVSSHSGPERKTVSSNGGPERKTVSSHSGPERKTVSSHSGPERKTVSSNKRPERKTLSSAESDKCSPKLEEVQIKMKVESEEDSPITDQARVEFQIRSDSAEVSKSKSKFEKDNRVEECGSVEDNTAKSPMSRLPLPIRCEGEPVKERAKKNTGFCKSMPTVWIQPAEQKCQMHKSSEALGCIESESSQATKVDVKPGMKPVLEQLCSSVQSIRQASSSLSLPPVSLEKSRSLPDVSSQVAAAFGSPSKTLLSFLSVMTLKDDVSSLGVDKSLGTNGGSCLEALHVMQSLEKTASIEDEEELRASLMSLQSSISSKLQQNCRVFQERNDIEESPPPSPKISEQDFALEVDSEGEDQNKEQPFGIEQLMEELNMSEELGKEISSLVEGEIKYSEDMDTVEQVDVVSKVSHSDNIEAAPHSSPLSEPETEHAVSEMSELCKSQDSEVANDVKALEETSDAENQITFSEDHASLAEQRDQQAKGESKLSESEDVDTEPHNSPISDRLVNKESITIWQNQDTETENEVHGETNCSEEENSNAGDQNSHEEDKHNCEERDMISESEDVDVRHHSDSQSESSPKETESQESVSKGNSDNRSTDNKKKKTVKPKATKDPLSLSPGFDKRQNDSLTGLFKDIRKSKLLQTLSQDRTERKAVSSHRGPERKTVRSNGRAKKKSLSSAESDKHSQKLEKAKNKNVKSDGDSPKSSQAKAVFQKGSDSAEESEARSEPHSSPLSEPEAEDTVSEMSELCKSQDSEATNDVKALEETSDTENQISLAEDQGSLAEQRDQQAEGESKFSQSEDVDVMHHSDSRSESSPKENESQESVSKEDSEDRSSDSQKKTKITKPKAKKDTLTPIPGSDKRQRDSLTGYFKDIRKSKLLETLSQGQSERTTMSSYGGSERKTVSSNRRPERKTLSSAGSDKCSQKLEKAKKKKVKSDGDSPESSQAKAVFQSGSDSAEESEAKSVLEKDNVVEESGSVEDNTTERPMSHNDAEEEDDYERDNFEQPDMISEYFDTVNDSQTLEEASCTERQNSCADEQFNVESEDAEPHPFSISETETKDSVRWQSGMCRIQDSEPENEVQTLEEVASYIEKHNSSAEEDGSNGDEMEEQADVKSKVSEAKDVDADPHHSCISETETKDSVRWDSESCKSHDSEFANENQSEETEGEEEGAEKHSCHNAHHPVEISQEVLDFINAALLSSTLTFTYDSRGNLRLEPGELASLRDRISAKSSLDSQYGQKQLPSPNTTELSDYRPETSDSGGYKSQGSVELSTESGERDTERQSSSQRHVRQTSERLKGRSGAEVQHTEAKTKFKESPDSKSASSLASTEDFMTKASMQDLAHYKTSSSFNEDSEPVQFITFHGQMDPSEGVLIDKGRWLLKENHLIRRSPPMPMGMYGTMDTTSIETGQENTSEDVPYSHFESQHCPLAVISSPELEEMAKPPTPKCTYFNMPHGSDSDPFQDDMSINSGKRGGDSRRSRDIRVSPMGEPSKMWARENSSLSSFASVQFKMPDGKIHPDGGTAVRQPARSQGISSRTLQEDDSVEGPSLRCWQHCPIL